MILFKKSLDYSDYVFEMNNFYLRQAEIPLEEASVAVQSTSSQPITSTAVKAAKKSSPALKIAEPLTPIIELQRMPTAEYKDSGARRKTVQKSQKKVAIENQKKSPLSAIPLNLTPMKSAKKKGKNIGTVAMLLCI